MTGPQVNLDPNNVQKFQKGQSPDNPPSTEPPVDPIQEQPHNQKAPTPETFLPEKVCPLSLW